MKLRYIVGAVVVLIGMVVLLSAAVGHYVHAPSTFPGLPESDGFNWELASLFGTALGTTLLALATFVLALSTAQEVKSTTEIAKATREESARQQTPLIVLEDMKIGSMIVVGRHEVTIKLRNVGLGAAIRGNIGFRYEPSDGAPVVAQIIEALSLLSGEQTSTVAVLEFPPALSSNYKAAEFTISGAFIDARGKVHGVVDGQAKEPNKRFNVDPRVAGRP